LHHPQRFPIALRVRHAEVPPENFLRVASALLPHHHHRLAVEARPPANNCRIVAKSAIAMELDEIGEDQLDELRGERPLDVASHLDSLPWGETVIDLVAQLGELLLERGNLLVDAHLLIAGETLELLYLALEL